MVGCLIPLPKGAGPFHRLSSYETGGRQWQSPSRLLLAASRPLSTSKCSDACRSCCAKGGPQQRTCTLPRLCGAGRRVAGDGGRL